MTLNVKMEKGICSRAEKRQPCTRKSDLGNILNQRCLQWDIQDSECPNEYLYASALNTDEFYMAHSWSQCPDISPIMYSHKIRQFDPLRGLSWSLRNYYVISSWPVDPLVAHYYETFQSSKPASQTPPTFLYEYGKTCSEVPVSNSVTLNGLCVHVLHETDADKDKA